MTIPTKTTKAKGRPLQKYEISGVVHGVARKSPYPTVGRRAFAVDDRDSPIVQMWTLCGKLDTAMRHVRKMPDETALNCIKCLAVPDAWPLKLSGVICGNCKDVVYSRANHDCRPCNCGKVSVDDGPGVGRIIGGPWTACHVLVYASPSELYNDWNKRKNKFGRISKRNQKDAP